MRAPYRPRPLMPLAAALVLVAASGIVMDAGFPDKGWWPLALVGVAGYLLALRGRTIGGALLLGFVGSMYFYLIHISWAEQFLGNIVPMLALCLAETLFFSAGSALITLAYRWVPRAFPTTIGVSALLPVIVAGLWTAREAVASVFPYGGFAWGRVALSQTESPVAQLFPWLGVAGVTFALVLFVAVVVEAVMAPAIRPLLRVTIPVALATALVAIPAFPIALDDTIRVGAVQGNGKAAYLDQREYGDLLRAQLDATRAIDPDEDLDVLLWPEGSTDVDPLREQSAARVFDALTEAYDAPLVAGSITTDDVDIWNSSLLWLPGEGLADKYDKRHPVPFGEYIPDRAFWRPFAPELIDLVQREYTIGTTDAVFDLGDVIVGVNICYDIVDDGLLRESVIDGAQVIFAQSNNADFGHTDESVQQLAIARARALELGRSIVNISTVGTSAILLSDGSTLTQLEWYQPGVMVEDVPTSTTMTPAALAGLQIEWLAGLFGLLGLVIAGLGARMARRG